ncbi:MAG: hypothetical protein QM770_14890 [Tepidisphaeraceae bacterium]
MSTHELTTPQRVHGRVWRPGCVVAARCRRWMRRAFVLLLFAAIGLMVVYKHFTDPARVRALAQSILSDIVRGDVTVGTAHASLFEGLTLEDVSVRARPSRGATSSSTPAHFRCRSRRWRCCAAT